VSATIDRKAAYVTFPSPSFIRRKTSWSVRDPFVEARMRRSSAASVRAPFVARTRYSASVVPVSVASRADSGTRNRSANRSRGMVPCWYGSSDM